MKTAKSVLQKTLDSTKNPELALLDFQTEGMGLGSKRTLIKIPRS